MDAARGNSQEEGRRRLLGAPLLVVSPHQGALELTLEVDRREKARRIACYTSQLLPLEQRLDDPETLPPSERYWLLERPAASD